MKTANCTEERRISRIKLEENGRSAVFLNLARESVLVTKIDGCVLRNQTAADWVLTWPARGELVLELKGRDVAHACEQIWETTVMLKEKFACRKFAALIVCAQFPRFNTAIQKAKTKYAKVFSAPLHVVSRNSEYDAGNVFSFKGPHRS